MTTPETPAEAFEAFYKDVRDRLLLQAWSLTGDLAAAQGGIRDALVVAWHHWGKLRRLPDDTARENWVRPIAWQHAQRRHSVPHLHRDRGIDEEARATLAAVGKLTTTQRRVLLLAHFAPVSLDQLSREVGITQSRAERELATATTQFGTLRGVPTTGIRQAFEPLAATVADARWPRPSILMRAGARRRRTHTIAGAVVTTAALLVAGLVVHSGGSAPSSLAALGWHDRVRASAPPAVHLAPSRMLTDSAVGTALGHGWSTSLTSDSGGTTLPCAPRAAAAQHSAGVLVRTFTGPAKHDVAGESVEMATTQAGARTAYATALRWYAGCTLPRVQLISAQRVSGVGDAATVLGLRDWSAPRRSLVVGLTRSGSLLTTVVASVPRLVTQAIAKVPGLLSSALEPLCSLPGAGACVTSPAASTKPVPRLGSGLLETVDLPPAQGITQPWAATSPAAAKTNPAASHCDDTSFDGHGVSHGLTRSFVVTKDSPSVLFGISETAGRMASAAAAKGFVHGIEGRLGSCAKRELGSTADRLATPAGSSAGISLWHVSVGSTHHRSTIYLMALVQRGRTVAQLSFVPSGDHTIDDAAFAALAERAAERLGGFGTS